MSRWLNYAGATGVVQNVGRRFFPLDEELGLLPGRYTPGLQETMTQLGSKMPFQEAVDELRVTFRTEINDAVPKKPWRPPPDHPWRRPWLPSRS